MSKNEKTEKLNLKIKDLECQLKQIKDAEKINEILFDISNAVNTTPNLEDLYLSIHKFLNRLVPVPNLYISIYDRENKLIHFPYYVDESDGTRFGSIRVFDKNSLTAEVILGKKPLMFDRTQLKQLDKEGRVVGTVPQIWLGVPLITDETVIGVLAIQNYSNPNAYTQRDLNILVSVSHQIAVAIERKRIHDALKENEERYRLLSEKSHDIIMRFNRSFQHIYVNPAVEQIGLKPELVTGKTSREIEFPDSLSEIWEEAINKVFNTQKMNRVEIKLPQGIWIDWILSPEFSSNNKVNSVISFARDITERKQLEIHNACYDRINNIIIAASDIEQMLNRILDAMIDIFNCDRAYILFPCDPKASSFSVPFLRFRPEWYLRTGHSVEMDKEGRQILEDVVNSKDPLIYDPVTKRKVRDHIRDVYFIKSQIVMAVFPKTGQAWEVGLHQCDHERIWLEEDSRLFKGICLRIADGISNMLFFRELQQANKYIENVFNSMPSILMGLDSQGRITQWNRQAQIDTGVMNEKAIGQYYYQFFPHLNQFERTIKKAIDAQKVIEKIKIPRWVNNKIIYENITIYPLKGTADKGTVIRMDNVTQQIQIDEMMIQSEKMLSIGGLAAGMAHEINNPLAGMMQNAQVIRNRLTQNIPKNRKTAKEVGTSIDTIRAYMDKRGILNQLENVNDAGKRAAEIVRNMLSFAKKSEGSKTDEDLVLLMDRTIELAKNDYDLKKRFDFRRIKITKQIDKAFPHVFCESGKLQQVFLNIIKNGAEAMADQALKKSDSPEFHIRYALENSMAVIKIKDNGPGIPESIRKRIFEPFYTTKSPDKGTGLGLSIAFFIIVEDHKGELSVKSPHGKGAQFIIKLPIYR